MTHIGHRVRAAVKKLDMHFSFAHIYVPYRLHDISLLIPAEENSLTDTPGFLYKSRNKLLVNLSDKENHLQVVIEEVILPHSRYRRRRRIRIFALRQLQAGINGTQEVISNSSRNTTAVSQLIVESNQHKNNSPDKTSYRE